MELFYILAYAAEDVHYWGWGLNLGISLRGCKLCLTNDGRLRFQAA